MNRKQFLEKIQSHSDYLMKVARTYDHLRFMALRDDASSQFIRLTENIGELTRDALKQTGNFCDIIIQFNKSLPDNPLVDQSKTS